MSLPIAPVSGAAALARPETATAAAAGKPGEFASLLQGAVNGVEQSRNQADQAVQNLLTGKNEELHTVTLAAEKAELTFDLALQIRNKVVDAYQEVMRMQL